MKSARCENCGAGVTTGALACAFCGLVFESAAPGGAAPSRGADPEVLRLLRAGKKIEAIRAYHKATKCSLGEAKIAVDALELALAGQR